MCETGRPFFGIVSGRATFFGSGDFSVGERAFGAFPSFFVGTSVISLGPSIRFSTAAMSALAC